MQHHNILWKKWGGRRRQVIATLNGEKTIVTQSGAMQWTLGNINITTGVKGAVTKESGVKPEYTGKCYLVLEPTYKYLILQDLENWSSGMTVEDGMFLACEGTVNRNVIARKKISSAIAGGEGLVNVYRGVGKVLMSAYSPTNSLFSSTNTTSAKAAAPRSNEFNAVGGIIGGMLD